MRERTAKIAEFHMSAQIISGGGGRSAVAAASYRRGTDMKAERTGQSHAYLSKHEVGHAEVMLPKTTPKWLTDKLEGLEGHAKSEALWNAVEMGEKRVDGTLAREVEVSLPTELSKADHVELVQQFSHTAFLSRGMAVDFAIHEKEGNPHAHIMTTLRPMTEEGWGPKKVAQRGPDGEVLRHGEGKQSRIIYTPFWGDKSTLLKERELWAVLVNSKLQARGVEARIDHRSYAERGLDVRPSEHRGIFANAMQQKDLPSPRLDAQAERLAHNAQSLMADPSIVLKIATQQSSVFDADDVSRVIARFVQDPSEFASVQAAVMGSDQLVLVAAEVKDGPKDRVTAKAKYSTVEIVKRETQMIDRAARMARSGEGSHVKRVGRAALASQVQSAVAAAEYENGYKLSAEQVAAVEHVTKRGNLQSVVGLAGAGKSTMLDAARRVWEQRDLNVRGITLAGKAAQELRSASGIESKTWASTVMSLRRNNDKFTSRDVIVVDEAGMVGSREMSDLLKRAEKAGARVVLVGDPKQLDPIGPGAAFRGIVERTGYAEMSEVRRQSAPWMRRASVDFARGQIGKALDAYSEAGCVEGFDKQSGAIASLADHFARQTHEVGGLIKSGRANGAFSIAAVAHSNLAVRALNAAIRSRLVKAGHVSAGRTFDIMRGARDAEFKPSEKATIQVGAGDRLVMLMNNKNLDVKNGTLGTVESVGAHYIKLRLEDGSLRRIMPSRYNTFDHGYALTVHKSQGATFNKTHVLATRTMNRNLTYVAMTRHRESANLYYGKGSFHSDVFKGGLYEALSRPSDKVLSTDYPLIHLGRSEKPGLSLIDRAAFGMRRGFDTAKALYDQVRQKVGRLGQRLDRALDKLGLDRPEFRAPVVTSVLPEPSGSREPLGTGWDKTLFEPMRPEISRAEWVDRALASDTKVQAQSAILKQACSETYKDPIAVHDALEAHALAAAHAGGHSSPEAELKALRRLAGKVGPAKLGKGGMMGAAINQVKGQGSKAGFSIGEHVQNLRVQLSGSIAVHSAGYDDYARQLETPVPRIRRTVIDAVDKLSGRAFEAEAKTQVLSSQAVAPKLAKHIADIKSSLIERFGTYERFLTPEPLGRTDDAVRLEALKMEARFFAQVKQLGVHQERFDLEDRIRDEAKEQAAGLGKGPSAAERSAEPEQTREEGVRERLGLKDTDRQRPQIDKGDRGDFGR